MFNVIALLSIICFSLFGFICLSLSLDRHWRDVIGKRKIQNTRKTLMQALGYSSLWLSCLLALYRDGLSMGAVLWFMILAGSGVCVAFILTWRAHWFLPLVLIMSKR